MKKQKHYGAVICALLWLCCVYSSTLQAQDASPPDSLIRYKWEIGTDLLWLIDKNSAPRFSVFARRNITTKNGKHRAWRLRTSFNYDYSNLDYNYETDTSDYYQRWNYEFFVRPGYEWQRTFGKFQLNYGLDAHIRWQRFDNIEFQDRVTNNGAIADVNFNGYTQTWEFGLVGFLGFKYFISPRFLVNAEANYSTIYQSFKYLNESFYTERVFWAPGEPTGALQTGHFQTISTNINPLYVLQLSYLFN